MKRMKILKEEKKEKKKMGEGTRRDLCHGSCGMVGWRQG